MYLTPSEIAEISDLKISLGTMPEKMELTAVHVTPAPGATREQIMGEIRRMECAKAAPLDFGDYSLTRTENFREPRDGE